MGILQDSPIHSYTWRFFILYHHVLYNYFTHTLGTLGANRVLFLAQGYLGMPTEAARDQTIKLLISRPALPSLSHSHL